MIIKFQNESGKQPTLFYLPIIRNVSLNIPRSYKIIEIVTLL